MTGLSFARFRDSALAVILVAVLAACHSQPEDRGVVPSVGAKANQDNVFNLSTVPHLPIRAADDKAGDHAETPIRRPALDYTETFEILRRYQGFGEVAVADAKLRMPLYDIFEKYNRIIRES
ncbi:hypothetical protein [Streptomyces sp. NPDC051162]|uniref:hypothetical protein n=1 Tax=unclassified Streptomyces TaxID=2593676 RepID=UPI00343856C2